MATLTNDRGYTYMIVDDVIHLVKTKTGKDVKHGGSGSGYAVGCRCKPCGKANTDRAARAKAVRLAKQATSGFKHGRSGYVNWGCTCDVCRADHNKKGREGYASRRHSSN